ncbi:hypothetical protein ACA910_012832 [Epithemia clementina (nom. ined.)]
MNFLSSHHALKINVDQLIWSKVQSNRIRHFSTRHGLLEGAKLRASSSDVSASNQVPLYRTEGLFAVDKPLNWTSQDMVSYIRGILERDARNRGAKPVKISSRVNKERIIRVGHGGTLDPLATGVLVVGVGRGTKELQSYLSGSKRYYAEMELGFETTTLDMDGNVTKRAPFDHVTLSAVNEVLPQFVGEISQVPPIFSAIKKDGKKLYESARKGLLVEDAKLEPRLVKIYSCRLVQRDGEGFKLPRFSIDVECGGGTYIRALVRDIGYQLNSVATTISLIRTKQAQFTIDECLSRDQLSPDAIYQAINRTNELMLTPTTQV